MWFKDRKIRKIKEDIAYYKAKSEILNEICKRPLVIRRAGPALVEATALLHKCEERLKHLVTKTDIEEGKVKKGGVNERPITQPPTQPPQGQGGCRSIQVVCDTSNNNEETIKKNEVHATIKWPENEMIKENNTQPPQGQGGQGDTILQGPWSASSFGMEPDVTGKYYDLLFAVERVFPDETRHETALRYIREAESRAHSCGYSITNGKPRWGQGGPM